MWGTPQRSRRISTGLRKPGRPTASACNPDVARSTKRPAASRRIYLLSVLEALGLEAVEEEESDFPEVSDLLDDSDLEDDSDLPDDSDLEDESDLPDDSDPVEVPLDFSFLLFE